MEEAVPGRLHLHVWRRLRRLLAAAIGLTLLAAISLAYVPGGARPAPVSRHPAPPGSQPVSFIAFGDAGSGSADQAAVRDRMVSDADSYTFAVMTGDGAYPDGTAADYRNNFFGVYGGLFQGFGTAPPRATSGFPKPVWPTLGNHDYDAENGPAGYREAFVVPDGPAGLPSESFYAVDVEGIHLVSFDSQFVVKPGVASSADITAAMTWLVADLEAHRDEVTVLIVHHPAYAAGPQHGAAEETAMRATWFPVFAGHGVDMVLSGHDHAYERNTPQSGLTSYVTGAGGDDLSRIVPQPYTAAYLSDYHYLRVTVDDCTISTVVARPDGNLLDPWSYTAPTCRGATPTAPPRPTPGGQLISDDFESGEITRWTSRQAVNGGTVVVQEANVADGRYAVQIGATGDDDSQAYLRMTFDSPELEMAIRFKAMVAKAGAADGNVRLLRLFDPDATRVISLYRQNTPAGSIYVEHSGRFNPTSAAMPLGSWRSFEVHVSVTGTNSVVEILLDGESIHRAREANLGTAGILVLQLGNDTTGQPFAAAWDDILVTGPGRHPVQSAAPIDASPFPTLEPTLPPGTELFRDDFEDGTLARWIVQTTGGAEAVVSGAAAATGSAGAQLTATTAKDSAVTIRAVIEPQVTLGVSVRVRVRSEGTPRSNVPLVRLFDGSGDRVINVYRQNATDGKLYVQFGGATSIVSRTLPLNTWAWLELRVAASGPTGGFVLVRMDGSTVFSSPFVGPMTNGITAIQFGNEVKRQGLVMNVDSVEVVTP